MIEEALTSPEVASLDSYIIINALQAEVVERRQVKLDTLFCPLKGQCSADADIACRGLLPLDWDPCRETGTASSPAQRDQAAAQAQVTIEYLVRLGFPGPAAEANSGNGRHGYFRGDHLPNTRETDVLLNAFYTCLARKFDTPEVKLDKSVRSAAQLMRMPGSYNFKAQRTCEIISFNEAAGSVSLDLIRKVLADLRGHLGFKTPLVIRQGAWTPELMEKFLEFYSIDFLPAVEIPQGWLFVLNPCPLDSSHQGSSPAVLVTKSGFPKFCCLHASCQLNWRQFRARLQSLTGKWFLTGTGKTYDI